MLFLLSLTIIIFLKTMNNTEYWDNRRGKVFSGIGGWRVGKGVYSHGFDLTGEDVAGRRSFIELHMLNHTGRLPNRAVADWCEMIYVGLSWPDARIWCNQVAAFAGETAASVGTATAASILAADSRLYGGATIVGGCDWLNHVKEALASGRTIKQVVDAEVKRTRGRVHIKGFARPIANGDERVIQLQRYARDLGFAIGDYERIALDVEAYLKANYGECMNMNGYVGAFLSDQGYTGQEMFNMSCAAVFSGASACFVDAVKRPYGSLMPMRCDDIEYRGKPKRALPA